MHILHFLLIESTNHGNGNQDDQLATLLKQTQLRSYAKPQIDI